MSEFEKARANMVESQVRTNDVTDTRIQDAMLRVPRERFVPRSKAALAYVDECVEIAPDRWLMDPRSFAKLVQAAEIRPRETVLVVGCGLGYSPAIIAALAGAVVALEEDEALAHQAGQTLAALEVDTAVVVTGRLAEGFARQAPYDVIFLDGAIEVLPEALAGQLAERGRLVAIALEGPVGRARVWTSIEGTLSERTLFDATVPLLPGFARKPAFVF
ncbi:MAG: protein-L-isoaspartate O-methyltransferase [Alphaproteobacteria bacterium]|nr:protein-L-isoaspartate O-methyltransferase [Alphaproteobacteria bacterium]